jgi:heme a synthase
VQRPVPLVAAWTAILTLVLMTLGGIVHAAGASLACPDGPLCYGQMLPRMVGGIALEHSHRLLGALVASLALLLAIVAHRSRQADTTDRRLAWAALGLVLVQAVLGGATVLVRLSPVLSTLHLAVALAFLGVLTVLAGRTPGPFHLRLPSGLDARLRRRTLLVLAVLYVQMVLGGLVRHTHASMACGADPWLCGGTLWPSATLQRLHMSHRLLAVVVALLILALAVRVVRTGGSAAKRLGVTAALLVVVQVSLGAASVIGVLPVWVVAAHLTVAALLWVTLLALWLSQTSAAPVVGPVDASPDRITRLPAS